MMFPLVRQLARAHAAVRVPVAVSCRVLGFSRQAYYAWLAAPVSGRDLDNAYLTNAAVGIHHDDPEFVADPHSPWQRPSNENTNGLLRQ